MESVKGTAHIGLTHLNVHVHTYVHLYVIHRCMYGGMEQLMARDFNVDQMCLQTCLLPKSSFLASFECYLKISPFILPNMPIILLLFSSVTHINFAGV